MERDLFSRATKVRPRAPFTALSLGPVLDDGATAFPPNPPTQPWSGAGEAKTFQLPPGSRMELIRGDPVSTSRLSVPWSSEGDGLLIDEADTDDIYLAKDMNAPTDPVSSAGREPRG